MKKFARISKLQKESYQKSLAKYGKSFKALRWTKKDAQAERFEQLLADVDLNGKNILDFGCGMGDIVPFIKKDLKVSNT